jgi:RibD C-terminal domain
LGRQLSVGDTPCFVVTHNKPTTSHPPLYTFVTDGVVSAIEQAKSAAGDKVVGLHGATVMQQALPLGLVDEIRVHVIPVLLGGGTPLFHRLDSAARPCLTGSTRRSPSNAPKCWLRLPRPTWDFEWSGKPQPDATRPAGFKAGKRCASRRTFDAYLPRRADDPSYTFRRHLSLDQRGDRGVEESEPAPGLTSRLPRSGCGTASPCSRMIGVVHLHATDDHAHEERRGEGEVGDQEAVFLDPADSSPASSPRRQGPRRVSTASTADSPWPRMED